MRSMYLHNPGCSTRAVCVVRSASVVTRVGFRHLQARIGMRIYYISLSWYISLHPSSIIGIEDVNIPYLLYDSICIENISHTTLFASDPQVPDCHRRLWVDMFALLTSLRQLPVSEERTTVCILTKRERTFFFVCKEVLQKYCKVLRQTRHFSFSF